MPNRDIKWKYFSLNATVFWLISDKQNFPNVPFHSLLNVAAIKQSDKQCSTEAAYETVRHCETVQAWKRFEKLEASFWRKPQIDVVEICTVVWNQEGNVEETFFEISRNTYFYRRWWSLKTSGLHCNLMPMTLRSINVGFMRNLPDFDMYRNNIVIFYVISNNQCICLNQILIP